MRLCKCEGPPPPEPVEEVPTLEGSRTHGVTYFRVSCRVAKHDQNAMEERGRTPDEIEAECERAERSAQEAFRRGVRAHPAVERYRVVNPSYGAGRDEARKDRLSEGPVGPD